jgi:hypothetical protein
LLRFLLREHLPSGALDAGGKRARATGDYSAWSPDGDIDTASPDDEGRP